MVVEGNARWAKKADMGLVSLQRVQHGLTVDSIMTPRSNLAMCRPDDCVRAIMSRNTERYSCLPVQDGSDAIVGLFHAERWFDQDAPERPVGDDFEPLSETSVVGVDTPIIEFLKTAGERPTKLVVSGQRIAGMVGLSDLQQLPVRAALFTVIASVELTMANWIEATWSNNAKGWLDILSKGRRAKVCEKIQQLKNNDSFVSEVLCTEFSDKCDIIRKRGPIPGSNKKLKHDFSSMRDLRDRLVHASYYAGCPEDALEVCSIVGRAMEIQHILVDSQGRTLDVHT